MSARIDIDKPRFDQTTYIGRAKHFFITTDPRNLLSTNVALENAKDIVTRYRAGEDIPGLSEDQLWRAKHLYDSAYHPDTGEKMFIMGRMSFQVPGNMSITGCMLTFYKSTPAVIGWQWINQTFNAIVNYTNRSGHQPISTNRLATSYALATTGAVVTALSINKTVSKMPPLVGRFVPFVAVAAANCINIPCMRSNELTVGIPTYDESGEYLGNSTIAARKAIFQVVVSRVMMATPGMLLPPIIMNHLEKKGILAKYGRIMGAPFQVFLCGLFLTFATPMCCALFPQMSSISLSSAEENIQKAHREKGSKQDRVFFNKGL